VLFGATAPIPAKSLAVNETRPLTPFTLNETATELTITTAKLRAHLDKMTGQLSFLDATGATLLTEPASARSLTPAMAGGLSTLAARQTFTTRTGEQFYGLGQHQQGVMTYNGQTTNLVQRNPGESSVPMLVSSGGYGLLWDNPSATTVDLATAGTVRWSSTASKLIDYYFMVGPEADDVIAQYRALTGPPPMFGRWVWGYWQSKERYGSQTEFLDIVQQYRTRMLPIDGIVQDWFYWDPAPWGSHEFDAQRYPDPTAMFAQAHTNHYHALLSVWARFDKSSYANYNALSAAGALVTPGTATFTYYDPFKPEGRTIYWQQMRDELFVKGPDAWWLDSTEPDLAGTWVNGITAAGPGAFVENAYPLMTTTAVYEGQRAVTSDKRVFILTRSAYSGQQRNAAMVWSGDINGDWATFKKQIPAGLNFSLSGIPYWNTDIGGFYPQLGGVATPQYAELFERWFQFGGFCAMFRSHGTGGDKNMWNFGAAGQAILLGVDQLRYRLLPYIYSLSWKVTHDGYSLMRGLVFDFRSDPRALNIPDQFMFGPALMVNPVTDAGVTSRSVYLPANTTWFDFWTGATSTGGQTVTASAPLDHLPLYVRAGSVLPLGPMMQYSTETAPDPMEVRVYPGADGSFTLYDDENDNYNYEKGMYATIPLTWNNTTRTLTIGARQGSYPGMAPSRTFRLVVVGPNHGAGTAVTGTADQTVTYTGAAVDLRVP
jgi:alpha-D-xyloside xylohydrolase